MPLNAATTLKRFCPPQTATGGCKQWQWAVFDDYGSGGGSSSGQQLLAAAVDVDIGLVESPFQHTCL
jgi:hypothetical protein